MRAKRSTHCSIGARRSCASEIMRVIRARTVSLAGLVASTVNVPSPLIVPANTSSPCILATGILSPVIGAWFTEPAPSTTSPSSAILSPARTTKRLPTDTDAAGTSCSDPSEFTKRTLLGARSSSADTAFRARPTLQLSSNSESANRKATVAASKYSPIVMAPSTAMIISRFMSGRRVFREYQALGRM